MITTVNENRANNPPGGKQHKGIIKTIFAKLRTHDIKTILKWMFKIYKVTPAFIIAPNSFLFWKKKVFCTLLQKYGFEIIRIIPHKIIYVDAPRLNYIVNLKDES